MFPQRSRYVHEPGNQRVQVHEATAVEHGIGYISSPDFEDETYIRDNLEIRRQLEEEKLPVDDREDIVDYDPMTSDEEGETRTIEPVSSNSNPYEEDSVEADSDDSNYYMRSTTSDPTRRERIKIVKEVRNEKKAQKATNRQHNLQRWCC